jgi:nucleoside-diphosphate-sugar epimerase
VTLLLVGGSGFLGRNVIVGGLVQHDVIAVYNGDKSFPQFAARYAPDVSVEQCDLTDQSAVKRLGQRIGTRVELCLFLAANTSVPFSVADPGADLRANTITLLNVLAEFEIDRLVFLSSGAVYDGLVGPVGPASSLSPVLPYAISKLSSEQYVRHAFAVGQLGSYSNVRFFGAFGPYEPTRKVYSRLVQEIGIEGRRRFVLYGDGSNLIDAMYVDDAVRAIVLAANDSQKQRTIDLASGEPITIRDLAQRAARVFDRAYVDIETSGVALEDIHFYPDATTFRREFGFSPEVSLEEGLLRLRAHRLAESGTKWRLR